MSEPCIFDKQQAEKQHRRVIKGSHENPEAFETLDQGVSAERTVEVELGAAGIGFPREQAALIPQFPAFADGIQR